MLNNNKNKKKKDKDGKIDFSDFKEKSIRYNFPKDKKLPDTKVFLYCNPPEVILQSKIIFKKILKHSIKNIL
jgi:hypothetical protein